jgi:hypothetical protein
MTRNKFEITQYWKPYAVLYPFYEKILTQISLDFSWYNNLFLPLDECYVLFRQWEKTLSDNLIFSIFLSEIEESYNKNISNRLIKNTHIPIWKFINSLK